MRFFLLIVCLSFLSFCVAQQSNQDISVGYDTNQLVVFSLDDFSRLIKNASSSKLMENEINEIEAILENCLKEYNIKQKKILDSLQIKNPKRAYLKEYFLISIKRYKRQYIPYIDENGNKKVWMNFFCHSYQVNWKKEIVSVFDGGNCYFEITIDLTNKKYLAFYVNGDA